MKIVDWFRNLFKDKPQKKGRPLSDDEFNELRSKRQKKLDSILDKIAKSGYDSLSTHERNFLDNY